ncbi:hypothetical protein HYH02_008143 [Chlamydomonas schloesseri]|uniref:Uncharacterized protein n=1 Tax=Chlamydomonas schloesseri TaxID=2026947 RepID=A0A835WGU3_9CHLO|nr:hypothetical protein HYH02_008143 [Chlamydomonas schloesseri]|eukprot:KAG2446989.1 hypothetical protein HYH02_008143 [Chlamydomonas schloesseri]
MDPNTVLACVTAAGVTWYIGHSVQCAGREVKDGLRDVKDGLERAALRIVQHMQEHGLHISFPAKKMDDKEG